jgi:hypothetical protein
MHNQPPDSIYTCRLLFQISYNELVDFIQGIGVHIQERISGLEKIEVNSFSSFMTAMFTTFWINKDHVNLVSGCCANL